MKQMFESTPVQKKLIAKEIVKKYLERREFSVQSLNNDIQNENDFGDFLFERTESVGNEKFICRYRIEVEVKSPMIQPPHAIWLKTRYPWAETPVYVFSKNQIERYKRYRYEGNGFNNCLCIVDEERESIYLCDLPKLTNSIIGADSRSFPELSHYNIQTYCCCKIKEFSHEGKINFNDLEQLRSIEPTVNSLRPESNRIPRCFISEIGSFVDILNNIGNLFNYHFNHIRSYGYWSQEELASDFQPQFVPYYTEESPNVIKIKNSAKKIAEIRSPNNTLLEVLEIENMQPSFFLLLVQFSAAVGFGRNTCPNYNYSLGNVIKSVAHFYKIFDSYSKQSLDIIAVKDVTIIATEYVCNCVDYIDEYKTVKEFLAWWEQSSVPYLEMPAKQNPFKEKVPLTDKEMNKIKTQFEEIQRKLNLMCKMFEYVDTKKFFDNDDFFIGIY